MMKLKKLMILGFLMLGVTFSGYSQLSSEELIPEIKSGAIAKLFVEIAAHDFGEISKGIPAVHTFSFVNEGEAPLLISRVKTSCGCTASNYTKEAIMPGEVGEVEVTYNASKTGSFNKTVSVMSNGGEQLLSVKGIVVD